MAAAMMPRVVASPLPRRIWENQSGKPARWNALYSAPRNTPSAAKTAISRRAQRAEAIPFFPPSYRAMRPAAIPPTKDAASTTRAATTIPTIVILLGIAFQVEDVELVLERPAAGGDERSQEDQ